MSQPVRDAIVEAIRDHGPISFAEYMERALYGPGGYYEHPPVGAEGDFVTSPHVHPVFAALLAGGIRQMAERLGDPSPLRLVEVGAGDGTLATQLLAHLDGSGRRVHGGGAERRGAHAARGDPRRRGAPRRSRTSPHIVLAHELLDNLPFRRVRMTEEGPREVRVGLGDGDRLEEVLAAPDAEGLERAAGLSEDDEVVLPDGALAFVDRLAAVLTDGMALLIDYGGVGSPGGLTHGYRSHRVTEDPLDEPGTADITAGVDFALIAERAQARGLVAFPSVTQRQALEALGFEAWARGRARGAASDAGRARRAGGRADVGRAEPRHAARRSRGPGTVPLAGLGLPRPGAARVARPALTLPRPDP